MNLTTHESGDPTQPAILFLHGLGVSSWMWTEMVEALQDDFYCLAVDLPGSGDSYQTKWLSFADTAVQLAALIREKTVSGRAHVVGLSLGGYAALQLLADQPDVVLTTIASGVTARPFPHQWVYKPLFSLMSHANRWDPTISLMSRMMQLPDEVKPLYRRDNKQLSVQTSRRIYAELLNLTLPPALQDNETPLLVAAGAQEATLVLAALSDFASLPHTQTRIVPNAHHIWIAEFPDLFCDMITAWVEQRPLPPALQPQPAPLPSQAQLT